MTRKSEWAKHMDAWQAAADALASRHRKWGVMLAERKYDTAKFVRVVKRLSRRFDESLTRIPAP